MLKILWVFCIYNELELLPFKMDFMKKNGLDHYVFDNMSDDGSWEWMKKRGVPSERFDTCGMFDLSVNIDLMTKKIHEIRPDWVIMAGADIFYVDLNRTLRGVIEHADRNGFNCIYDCFKTFQFMFTGSENGVGDPRLSYMHYEQRSLGAILIAKYSKGLRFKSADYLVVSDQRPYRSDDFVMLHYSIRHDAEKKKTEEYNRRKKAWEAGRTARCYGTHLERIVKNRNFIFDKNKLTDVRNSPFWRSIEESTKQ